ncbi:MAG TPA: class I tRNA ligase family protein, partial [Bacteroidales bacterium]|nr:class I tRNA ligase family protein [Bacteroidales bacterium]
MSKKFPEYKGLDLPKVNDEVLKMWDDHDTFRKSLRSRDGKGEFVFYEGPPSANGMPGIHHVMSRAIKDTICRFRTLQGYEVKRKAGWDTHGLPVELGVEKTLGITKEDIGTNISIEDYNKACRKDVMKFTDVWENLTRHMGFWIDMDNPYITYDNRYIETVWWLLKQLYDKELLYEGYTIQPYSPAAGTGLSSHELNMPGCYKDVRDTTCIALFSLIRNEKSEFLFAGAGTDSVKIMAWTTTPWTLSSNTALAVGADISYVRVSTTNPYTSEPITVILAEDLVSVIFAPDKKLQYTVTGKYKGTDLKGIDYEQLIDWVKPDDGAFRVITGDFVTTVDGTGIVHIAPTFGADDYRAGREHGIPPLMVKMSDGFMGPLVDRRGRMVPLEDLDQDFVASRVNKETYGPFAGRYVKNEYDETIPANSDTLDVDIAVTLKQQGKVFRIEKQVHNYPHCWRTDKPVLYYPLDSWFIR